MASPEPAKSPNPAPRSGHAADPAASARAVPLSRLDPGRRAIIARVDPDRALGRRLLDLGFVPGSQVRVVRRAPLGDPVAYEVRGTQLCLRGEDARHIWVRALDPDRG
jgi:Fe2+ transport system protein FeoA